MGTGTLSYCGYCRKEIAEHEVLLGDVPFHPDCVEKYVEEFSDAIQGKEIEWD